MGPRGQGGTLRYDVVIVGFRLNASLKPAQALQLVLGMDAETSKELTRRFPANVLTGVSLSRAERVSAELTDAGAKVEVRESRLSLAHDGGGRSGSSSSSQADRPPVIAELPDGSRRAPPHADRHEEASGNYEIGEILAPLGRGGGAVAQPPANTSGAPAAGGASTPAGRRASREELDQALRDSLRPNQAAAEPSEPAPPQPEKPVEPRPGAGEPRQPPPAAEPFEVMDNSAFAGMQNFGGGLDGFASDDSPLLQVDEVAMRSIQRRPEPATQAASLKPALAERLGSWWSRFTEPALEWGAALLSLAVVGAITLLAVGYALDPEHVLRPIGLEALPASAKKLVADLFGG
jgi:hypothetical protein